MIISLEKAKELITFPDGWSDAKIKLKLLAVEQTIRAYTNNNFQDRDIRRSADINDGLFFAVIPIPFAVGDTIQISETALNKGLFTVAEVDDYTFSVEESVIDEADVLVTKISYPADVVDCCLNLMEWEIKNRDKVGIKSETLSRHSVTYEDSASMFRGYPKGILNAVNHYRKVRC